MTPSYFLGVLLIVACGIQLIGLIGVLLFVVLILKENPFSTPNINIAPEEFDV